MSFTDTHSITPKALSKRANLNIFLSESPLKRSRVSPTMSANTQSQSQLLLKRNEMVRIREGTPHSPMQLHSWTFCAASVAPVRVKDVLGMDAQYGHHDFYWMGRVPCRSVKLVGIIIGIDEFEDKYRFKLDDGTGVIDCDIKYPKPPAMPQKANSARSKATSQYTAPPPKSKLPAFESKRTKKPAAPAALGSIIRTVGKISEGRGSRFLRVEPGDLSICDANEEQGHSLEVLRLRKEYYYSPDPFVIPKQASIPDPTPAYTLASTSISTFELPTSSAPSSPSASSPPRPSSSSNPAGSLASTSTSANGQTHLRHPSRLRSADLTDVTFRIYVKHFLLFAPAYSPPPALYTISEDEDSFGDRCGTPTPTRTRILDSLETPKPRQIPSTEDEDEAVQYGFTLSYLRRVPVLAQMARAVAHAEAKRRAKSSKTPAPPTSSSASSSTRTELERTHGRMKRLFQKTIRDLYRDGDIFLSSGPVRPCAHAREMRGDDEMWKRRSSSKRSDVPVGTTSSGRSQSMSIALTQEEEEDYLTEPSEHEESYLPITPRTLAPSLLKALRTLTGVVSPSLPSSRLTTPSSLHTNSRQHRPPTLGELTTYLKDMDAMWANLGSWHVQACLEYLQTEELVFKAGEDRWAVCI